MSSQILSHKDIEAETRPRELVPWIAVGSLALTSFIILLCQGNGRASLTVVFPSLLLVGAMLGWNFHFPSLPTSKSNPPTIVSIIGVENHVGEVQIFEETTGDELIISLMEECKVTDECALTLMFAGKIIDQTLPLETQGITNGSQIVVLLHENGTPLPDDEEEKDEEEKKDEQDVKSEDEDSDSDDEPPPALFDLDSDDTDDSDDELDDDIENMSPQWMQIPVEVDAPDMITLERGDEVRFSMMCQDEVNWHALTQSSLLSYLQHAVADRKYEIQCPKCACAWDYAYLRRVLNGYEEFTEDVRMEIEQKLSANLVSTKMNAKRCSGCTTALRRSVSNINFSASCVGCGGTQFCWACRTPWKKGAVACANIKCPSWIREVTCAVLKKCPTKHIDHMNEVPVLRACPTCGQLITHISDCKHMDCPICHRSFCFICVKPADEYGNYQCGYDTATCPLAIRQSKDDVVPTGLRSYSSILGSVDCDSTEMSSNHGEDVQEIDAEMGSTEFYEKFATEILDNLQAAGWNDEYYDDDDY